MSALVRREIDISVVTVGLSEGDRQRIIEGEGAVGPGTRT